MVNEFNGIGGGVCWSSLVGFCLTMIGETEERQMERRNKNGKEIKWGQILANISSLKTKTHSKIGNTFFKLWFEIMTCWYMSTENNEWNVKNRSTSEF